MSDLPGLETDLADLGLVSAARTKRASVGPFFVSTSPA